MRISPHTHTLISNTYRERSRPTERLISVHTQTHTPESSSGDSLTHSLWCSLGEVAGPALLLAKLQGGPTPSLSSSLLPLLFSCQLQRSSATLSLLCHFPFLSLHVFFLLFFLLSCHFFLLLYYILPTFSLIFLLTTTLAYCFIILVVSRLPHLPLSYTSLFLMPTHLIPFFPRASCFSYLVVLLFFYPGP